MTVLYGHDEAAQRFLAAWRSGRMHHAWLIAGPRGVGKASFARAAAARMLAEAAGPSPRSSGLTLEADHPTARLIAAGSHPDYRLVERLDKPTGGKNRNIKVDQIRGLGEMLSVTPSMSPWRAIVIDAADDMEKESANALLKMLEEPPANTVFFLVAHAPGRLLPTIRSRCRRLDLAPLADDAMTSWASACFPDKNPREVADLVRLGEGRPGLALDIAELDLAPLEAEAQALMRTGDPDNSRRSALAKSLSAKGAADRYAAFLSLVPSLVAREARQASGTRREAALEAYGKVRETAALAPRLSLDPSATLFELGGILASVAVES